MYKILAYFRDVPHENRPQLFHVLRRDGESCYFLPTTRTFLCLVHVDEELTVYVLPGIIYFVLMFSMSQL